MSKSGAADRWQVSAPSSGGRANLRWIVGAAESAPLVGPYALVSAGASLHWMRWPRALPRVADAMNADAKLAIVEHGPRGEP